MIEDLDSFFRIPADCKIINEEKLDLGIILLCIAVQALPSEAGEAYSFPFQDFG